MSTQTHRLFLGVDGGGTKTTAWLATSGAATPGVPFSGQAGPSNPRSVEFNVAMHEIEAAVQRAFAAAGMNSQPVAVACLAIAGSDRAEVREAIEAWAESANLAHTIVVCNDARPIVACLPEAWGVAVISGTGSFAYARDRDGDEARAGGWGYRLGDEGSGYALAVAGLAAAARSADGRGPATELLNDFLRHFACRRPRDLLDRIYAPEMDRQAVAQLAPVVLSAALRGDEAATAIRQQAAEDLAELVLAVQRRLQLDPAQLPVAVAGGVLIHSAELRESLQCGLRQRGITAALHCVPDPVAGALLLAQAAE